MGSSPLPALTSGAGFRAAFSISFETALPPLAASMPPPPPVPIPTIVPVSSDFFEADVTVTMDATEASNTFCARIYGMGDDIYSLLTVQTTIVHITLGYDDGASVEVMTGLLTEKAMEAGDQWYEATLKGVDFVFDRLQRPAAVVAQAFQGQTVGAVASSICQAVGVDTQIPDPGPMLATRTFNDQTPFAALNILAGIACFSLQAKDGKLWMGTPASLGVIQTTPITDGATSRPVATRGATAAASAMDGQDFAIAGIPSLRPSDLVTLGTANFQIQSITHKLTREGGYICTGRALSPTATADDAQKAGRPSASVVARQIGQNLLQRDRNRPALDVGDVASYTAGDNTATFSLGYDTTPDMVSPTIGGTLRTTPTALNDKPIASPFAFDNCGLVAPVYPGMRALMAHGWNEPEDAIASGFVWTSDMTPPQNQAGDWWLCLPTELGGDGKPTGSAVNDLTTGDGQRVLELKGLTINIGSGLLSSVGERPSPGTDESLTIVSDDNKTQVTFKQGVVSITDGTATLTVGNPSGQIVMTDGKVKLTLANGQISIGS
ncbi:MAG TPA: hypothetical protein VMB84_11665 [Stellaceae bacterium]|nr:hypothetical protein [Stellaceae bacterium]